jgi:hypothetical protein
VANNICQVACLAPAILLFTESQCHEERWLVITSLTCVREILHRAVTICIHVDALKKEAKQTKERVHGGNTILGTTNCMRLACTLPKTFLCVWIDMYVSHRLSAKRHPTHG